jgi:polyhydroxybutyrate depolymerase
MRWIFVCFLAACGSSKPAAPDLGGRGYFSHIPPSYNGSPMPLVVMLHGYGFSASLEEAYFQLSDAADRHGFLYAYPDSTFDSKGQEFWNATDACCNFDNSPVDDSGFLNGVIDDMASQYNVDLKRVYFVGHSNGGFMSYRMACDHAERIAAIMVLAGAMWEDLSKCSAGAPVGVLHVHGDMDSEVSYYDIPGEPGAKQSVADWAGFNGCTDTLTDTGQTLDLIPMMLDGKAETTIARYSAGCRAPVELWTITNGTHIPPFAQPNWADDITSWLLKVAKP